MGSKVTEYFEDIPRVSAERVLSHQQRLLYSFVENKESTEISFVSWYWVQVLVEITEMPHFPSPGQPFMFPLPSWTRRHSYSASYWSSREGTGTEVSIQCFSLILFVLSASPRIGLTYLFLPLFFAHTSFFSSTPPFQAHFSSTVMPRVRLSFNTFLCARIFCAWWLSHREHVVCLVVEWKGGLRSSVEASGGCR